MQDKKQFFIVAICGMAIGVLNGLFGGGGGMLCVPILNKIFNLDQKQSHATAIFIMLPISITSTIVYITTMPFDFFKYIWLILGVVLGGLIGGKLLNNTKNDTISLVFAIVMLAAGIKMLL